MKILYVAGRWDPRDHNQGSGIDYEFYTSLVRTGAEVEIVGPFKFGFSFTERILMKIHSKIFKTRLKKYPISYFIKSGRQVNEAIKKMNPDIIASKFSAPLLFANIDRPLVYMCDSTAKWLKGKWKIHSNLALFGMTIWETKVIKKCDHIITFSEANAKVLQDTYKIPSNQITVFAIPASIPNDLVLENENIQTEFDPIKLLLVGREYYRKGVDIAIEIVEKLNRKGINAKLRVVGLDEDGSKNIQFMGLYNKTIPSELSAYIENYRWADFLLHPARFEAAGIVPSEAAAFGVPTLTNNVGGLGTTVKDGISGIVFPKDSPSDMYVKEIIDLVNNPDAYHRLAESTRERYNSELNWPSRDKTIYRIFTELLK